MWPATARGCGGFGSASGVRLPPAAALGYLWDDVPDAAVAGVHSNLGAVLMARSATDQTLGVVVASYAGIWVMA